MSKDSYEKIKDKSILELMKNYMNEASRNSDNNKEYILVESMIMDILRSDMDIKINNSLKKPICEVYNEYYNEKNNIVKELINNNYESIKSEMEKIIDKNNLSIDKDKAVERIKTISNQIVKYKYLNIPDDVYKLIADKKLDEKKYIEILKMQAGGDTDLQKIIDAVRAGFIEKLNSMVGLTKTVYEIENEDSIIKLRIEPTVKAAIDESLDQVKFVENTKGSQEGSVVENCDNNFIDYESRSNTRQVQKKSPVSTVPILSLNRNLSSKNHVVYEKMQNNQVSAMDCDGGFAKDSVVTLASNLVDMTGSKKVYIEIDSSLQVNQNPKIYYYNDKNELQFLRSIDNFTEDDTSKNHIYSVDIDCSAIHDMIIIYSVNLSGDKSSYENKIKVSGLSKGIGDVTIQTSSLELPDLY